MTEELDSRGENLRASTCSTRLQLANSIRASESYRLSHRHESPIEEPIKKSTRTSKTEHQICRKKARDATQFYRRHSTTWASDVACQCKNSKDWMRRTRTCSAWASNNCQLTFMKKALMTSKCIKRLREMMIDLQMDMAARTSCSDSRQPRDSRNASKSSSTSRHKDRLIVT